MKSCDYWYDYDTVMAEEDEGEMPSDEAIMAQYEHVSPDAFWREIHCSDDEIFRDEDEKRKLLTGTHDADWPTLKEQLNEWGRRFSAGDRAQRVVAVERILKLVHGACEFYNMMDGSEEAKTRYMQAARVMQLRFKGETDAPVRFLKEIYPEGMFNQALWYTLGFSMSSRGDGTCKGYDHTKGTKYVSYLTTMLRFFCSRRRRELSKEFDRSMDVQRGLKPIVDRQQREESAEEQCLRWAERRRQTDMMVNWAMLTIDAVQCSDMVKFETASDEKEKKQKGFHAKYLKWYYSFELVNFSRFAIDNVNAADDRALMGAADHEFLCFATTIEQMHYACLVRSSLSDYVLEHKLYTEDEDVRLLQQRAVAVFYKKKEPDISKAFGKVKEYLRMNRSAIDKA